MGEQVDPGDSIDFTIPRISGDVNIAEDSLADYLGIPPGLNIDDVNVSALPFRAYNAIYNFWFRDENLINSANVALTDGPDIYVAGTTHALKRRRKRRDYITAGLPFPQKGPAVNISLAGRAPVSTDVVGDGGIPTIFSTEDEDWHTLDSGAALVNLTALPGPEESQMFADLGQATSFTINDLRESFQIQKLLERDARGGTRYPEILRSHFQVSDPGLLVHQRPVFLGGGHSRINITPVEQQESTASSGPEETPQGNLAAYGTVSASGHGFTYSPTEHGHIIGLVNIRADLTYQQGLERYWSRQTRYDFYFPVLSHLGEQAVLNKEIFVSNDIDIDDAVFAYMPRYDEYRFKQSQITALFRSAAADSLDVWHLAQDFATLPALNQAFIEDNPPIDRVVAVPSEPDMLLDVYFKIRAARPLPLYATPGLIDHF